MCALLSWKKTRLPYLLRSVNLLDVLGTSFRNTWKALRDPWAEDALKEQWWYAAEILSSLRSWGTSLWVKDEDDLLRHSMEAYAATACATLVFWGKQETSDLSNVNSELLTRAKFCLKGKEQQEWSLCLVISSLVLHHPLMSVPEGQKESSNCLVWPA